jgi:hypothetical protein
MAKSAQLVVNTGIRRGGTLAVQLDVQAQLVG